MKILISHLPKNKWWGHGTPIYKDNPAMRQGIVPNQELVEIEMYILTQLFNRLPIDVVEVDFPQFLDQQNLDQRQHDFVFVRDLFISNQKRGNNHFEIQREGQASRKRHHGSNA